MRKLLFLIIVVMLASCSAVTVTDSWSNMDMSSAVGEKIAVIAKTTDNTVREKVEQDMVASLNAAGFQAISTFSEMSMIDPDKKVSEDDVEAIKQALMDKGYNHVMMIVLKSKENYLESNSSYTGYNDPGFYGAGFYRGFGAYYGSMYNYGTSQTTTTVNKKYIIESVVYDLTQPQGKSLMAAVTTTIDDPTSMSKTAEDMADKVVKTLMKPAKK